MFKCPHTSAVEAFLYKNNSKKSCSICNHNKHQKYYKLHKEELKEKYAIYRRNNPDKVKEIKARSRITVLNKKDIKIQRLSNKGLEYLTKLKNIILDINEIIRESEQS